jgi:hypothetical protein
MYDDDVQELLNSSKRNIHSRKTGAGYLFYLSDHFSSVSVNA